MTPADQIEVPLVNDDPYPLGPRCKRKNKDGQQCVKDEHGRKADHLFRPLPVEPTINEKILILEFAMERPTSHLWSRLWTYADNRNVIWFIENGYLTEEYMSNRRYFYEGQYLGFSWSGQAPYNKITAKGRALVAQHAMVEW